MTRYNEAILEAAGAYLGLTEWPGAKSNPKIDAMFDAVGHPQYGDETAWCAAFVGAVLASLGLPHTGKVNARSYENYGARVNTQEARPGDIVVLWRGSKTSWQGHVGFFVAYKGGKVVMRGGNQGNAVSDELYDIDRIVAIRRADGVEASGKRPVLREGDSGAFVLDAQSQLKALGYTVGMLDQKYGSRTLAAVVAFQNDNGLVADGIIGDKTWAAMRGAPHRERRDVTKLDLEGSRTMKAAKEGKNTIAIGSVVLGGAAAVEAAEQAVDVAQRAGSILERVTAAGPMIIIVIGVAVVAYLAWKKFSRVEEVRLDDAQTGANDSR